MPATVTSNPSDLLRAADRDRWPELIDGAGPLRFSVRVELDGLELRIVRALTCDEQLVTSSVVWSARHPGEQQARDAYDALTMREADLQYWSVAAAVLGPGWLTPRIAATASAFVDERAAELERVAREEEAAREEEEAAREEEETRRAARKAIDGFFRKREDKFVFALEHRVGRAEFWAIRFGESWERDRFWDWLRWNTARYAEFADFLQHGTALDLERQLLREMLVTEQTVKKQGLGSGGRRPLRFWRGEL